MTSETSFKYIDRKKTGAIALVPGWATDSRVFESLDLEFNYLLPLEFSPHTFETLFLKALKENNAAKVVLLGWSLGGFVAAAFASKYPGLVDELILIGIRKKYDPGKLAEIRNMLKRNKKAYLKRFYAQCWTDARSYDPELDHLLEGLDYLADAEIRPEDLRGVKKIKIMHGAEDTIAPIEEAKEIADSLPNAEFVRVGGKKHAAF